MHAHAATWILGAIEQFGLADADVLDLGGKTVFGDTYYASLFTHPPTVVDLQPGPDVHVVADAADWEPDREYSLVLCTEVFEHTPRWSEIIGTAHKALSPGGWLIATCARDARPPHSAIDGAALRPGEYYQNLHSVELKDVLAEGGWVEFAIYEVDGVFGGDDLYCWARK